MAARHRFAKHLLTFMLALILGFGPVTGLGVGATPSEEHTRADKVVINIPSRTLWVYRNDRIVRYFPVGVGRPGYMTPLGRFSVIRKIIQPGWEHPYKGKGAVRIAPGERNPLGSRWIGFHQKNGGEYGMHGTDRPSSVGRFSSHGCVRMKKHDVEALFEMVDVGTPVEVVYEPVLIRQKDQQIRLIVYKDVFRKGMPSAQELYDRIRADYPNARIDMEKIQAALKQRNEKPIDVAVLESPQSPSAPPEREAEEFDEAQPEKS